MANPNHTAALEGPQPAPSVHQCSCQHTKIAPAPSQDDPRYLAGKFKQRGMASEPVEAIAEPLIAAGERMVNESNSDICMPWFRFERDADKFRACQRLSKKIGRVETSKQIYEFIRPQMEKEDQEVYYVLALDTQLMIRGYAEICRGARDRVLTPIQDTARYAIAFSLLYGAQAVAIAHNHPSGKPNPSDADKDVTKAVKESCDANELLFMDHVICGIGDTGDDYYSFRDHGLLK